MLELGQEGLASPFGFQTGSLKLTLHWAKEYHV